MNNIILEDSNVDDACVEHLAHMPSLRSLDLTHTAVTDAALHSLAKSKVKQLILAGDYITADGLTELETVKSLDRLDLKGCQHVSDRDVFTLREHLPNCRIEY